MQNFFKRRGGAAQVPETCGAERGEQEERGETAAAGTAAAASAQMSAQQAAQTFAKPAGFDRSLLEDTAAMNRFKKNSFAAGVPVKDPYTGTVLVLKEAEAKALYGDDWGRFAAQTDHKYPLANIHKKYGSAPWLKTEDTKAAANSTQNLEMVSQKFNNAKRDRTNKAFVEDEDYLNQKGLTLSDGGKRLAIERGEAAKRAVGGDLDKKALSNAVHTGHRAGVEAAVSAGTMSAAMSGITNIVAVIQGKKEVDEALAGTALDAGKGVAMGYAMGSGLTVVSHSLSNTESAFLQKLASSQVPGKVVTAVLVTGGTLKKFAEGDLTAQECILELGETGLNVATVGYAMAVGQELIPIPVVGAAVGALVGSALTSGYYHYLIERLQQKQLEHEERLRVIAECQAAAQQARAYRLELEACLEGYFADCRACFDAAIAAMRFSFLSGDTDGMIAAAQQMTEKLGGELPYTDREEFKKWFDSRDVLEYDF